jgi:hypothetical protein
MPLRTASKAIAERVEAELELRLVEATCPDFLLSVTNGQ